MNYNDQIKDGKTEKTEIQKDGSSSSSLLPQVLSTSLMLLSSNLISLVAIAL